VQGKRLGATQGEKKEASVGKRKRLWVTAMRGEQQQLANKKKGIGNSRRLIGETKSHNNLAQRLAEGTNQFTGGTLGACRNTEKSLPRKGRLGKMNSVRCMAPKFSMDLPSWWPFSERPKARLKKSIEFKLE